MFLGFLPWAPPWSTDAKFVVLGVRAVLLFGNLVFGGYVGNIISFSYWGNLHFWYLHFKKLNPWPLLFGLCAAAAAAAGSSSRAQELKPV